MYTLLRTQTVYAGNFLICSLCKPLQTVFFFKIKYLVWNYNIITLKWLFECCIINHCVKLFLVLFWISSIIGPQNGPCSQRGVFFLTGLYSDPANRLYFFHTISINFLLQVLTSNFYCGLLKSSHQKCLFILRYHISELFS